MRTKVAKADLVLALRRQFGAALDGPAESLAVSIEGLTLRPVAGAYYGLTRDADRGWVLTYDPCSPSGGESQVRRGILTCAISLMGLLSAAAEIPTRELVAALWPLSSCQLQPANDAQAPVARRA